MDHKIRLENHFNLFQEQHQQLSWHPSLPSSIAWDRGTNKVKGTNIPVFLLFQPQESAQTESMMLPRLTEINADYPEPRALCNCKVRRDWLNATGPKPLLGGYCYLDVLTGLHFPGLLCHSSQLCHCAQANASPPFPLVIFFFPEQYCLSSDSYKSAFVWATSLMLVTH